MIRTIKLDDGSELKVPGVVPKLSETPGSFEGGGPKLGQHTDEILHRLGIDAKRIEQLKEKGVV
jgi:formyl-CoA transferase